MPAERDAPPADTVAALLLARSDDDSIGLRFEDRSWTWREHVHESRRRAQWLAARFAPTGGRPVHVGVLLDNVPEFSFLLGAAALLGAVSVGLNTTRRGAELLRDIGHTDCDVVITDRRHSELLAGVRAQLPPVVLIDEPAYLAELGALDGAGELIADPHPDGNYLLIFTSGTTSAPKAVRCSQGSIARRGRSIAETAGVTAADVVYVSMPLFHSNAIVAGWSCALAGGAPIVLREKFSASGLLPDIRRYGVTYLNYVGKPLSYVLSTPEQPDDWDNPLRLAYGNEASDHDITEFARRFGCQVRDAFGTTEGGLRFLRTPETPAGSIGLARSDVRVLDPVDGAECERARFDTNGILTNPGTAIGELVNCSGSGSFEGYYNNDEANALRLRDGRYWSGDLAYRDQDGFFFYAGRTDDWLRVDGENLAIAPIERLLSRYPGVTLAAVYAVPDAVAGDRVMAALVLEAGVRFDGEDFAAWLSAAPDLGQKWWPSFVRISAHLPSTATNKVLKRVLAAERWCGPDPVWWSPANGRPYERLDAELIADFEEQFARHGRSRLIRTGASDG